MLLHHYLEDSVRNYPEKIAIRSEEGDLSYQELHAQSNCIAHNVIKGSGNRLGNIGIYLPKQKEAVSSILGVLKAGCAYVPLDFDSPVERIGYITNDCNIEILITNKRGVKRLNKNEKKFPGVKVILCLDEQQVGSDLVSLDHTRFITKVVRQSQWDNENDLLKSLPINKDNLAYILYTSGSTGVPKGVALTHKNGVVFVEWAVRCFKVTERDVFSSHAPFHFDLSIFDIYACLKVSGTLCLIPKGLSYFPEELLKYIFKNKITVWYSVPTALMQFLTTNIDLFLHLKSISVMLYAGEVFPWKSLKKLIRYIPDSRVFNLYGPTETNVITYFEVNADTLDKEVPIGDPCDYAVTEIIDIDNQRVIEGESGELIVKGDSLMMGYWEDQEKTGLVLKEVEIDGVVDKYYFTGDIVRKNKEGVLVYRGRRDNMIKTRGFRVELGEIESVLNRFDKILSVVMAVPDSQITNKIIAYIKSEINIPHSQLVEKIYEHCASFLPTYMIPEKIMFVEEFPLTSTGKKDRRLLLEMYNNKNKIIG